MTDEITDVNRYNCGSCENTACNYHSQRNIKSAGLKQHYDTKQIYFEMTPMAFTTVRGCASHSEFKRE